MKLHEIGKNLYINVNLNIVKLRQGSGKDRQGMALKVKGLKALNPCLELTLKLVATHPPPPTHKSLILLN